MVISLDPNGPNAAQVPCKHHKALVQPVQCHKCEAAGGQVAAMLCRHAVGLGLCGRQVHGADRGDQPGQVAS